MGWDRKPLLTCWEEGLMHHERDSASLCSCPRSLFQGYEDVSHRIGCCGRAHICGMSLGHEAEEEADRRGEDDRARQWVEENTEDFTIVSQFNPMVAPAVRSIPFGSFRARLVEDDGVTFVIARPKDWKAVLTRTLQDHRTCTYNFRFIQWEDKADKVHMNVLLTAVEKLFLSLDPNVKVHVRKMNVKTTYR